MSIRVTTGIALTLVFVVGLSGSVLVSPPAPLGDIVLKEPTRFRAEVTAYSSSPDETWGDPFITASGRRVADGIVACPRRYPFGTQFRIGPEVYTCWDRLHPRFDHRFDIWKPSKEEALTFGLRRIEVEVL